MEQKILDAYALGYHHGCGGLGWVGEIYTDDEYVWYVRGYEKGVADYCEEEEEV